MLKSTIIMEMGKHKIIHTYDLGEDYFIVLLGTLQRSGKYKKQTYGLINCRGAYHTSRLFVFPYTQITV